MVITNLEIWLTWILKKYYYVQFDFYYLEELYSYGIIYRSLPLSCNDLGHMPYYIPIPDSHNETFHVTLCSEPFFVYEALTIFV